MLSTTVGLALGVASATRPNSLLDRLSAMASLFGASMPSFWLGIVLMVIFALRLGWLPASGMYAPYGGGDLRDLLAPPGAARRHAGRRLGDDHRAPHAVHHAGDARPGLHPHRARQGGASSARVVLRHGLKNALIPIVTVIGVQAGYLLGGAVLTETVFAWPGVGTLMVQGILARDFPLVQGCVLVVALTFVLVNLAVDLLYAWLDPRIRYE